MESGSKRVSRSNMAGPVASWTLAPTLSRPRETTSVARTADRAPDVFRSLVSKPHARRTGQVPALRQSSPTRASSARVRVHDSLITRRAPRAALTGTGDTPAPAGREVAGRVVGSPARAWAARRYTGLVLSTHGTMHAPRMKRDDGRRSRPTLRRSRSAALRPTEPGAVPGAMRPVAPSKHTDRAEPRCEAPPVAGSARSDSCTRRTAASGGGSAGSGLAVL